MTDKPNRYIPDEEWETIVRHVPIVSVDLVIRVDDGALLGKRQNEPAKDEWFVPGGRVYKCESRQDAVHRVAIEELGVEVTIDRQIGTFEHFYDTVDVDNADGKHYLATGFVVTPSADHLTTDNQHAELRVFEPPFPDLHSYVEQYLDEIDW